MLHGRHSAQGHRRKRPRGRVILGGASILCVCAGIAVFGQIGGFLFHSSTAGHALVSRELKAIAAASGHPAACQPPSARTGGREPAGLLLAPSLGLVAPVLQGTGDAVLSDAVGHDPASVWPGRPGTSVLSAHDVTWFSRLDALRTGSRLRYVTPCWTYTYQVTSHAVVAAGSPVYSTGTARLILETCYPLNALYLTSRRYLVYATLAGSSPTHATAGPPSWPAPAAPAPARLAAQGLDLTQNRAPLGTLRLTGSPSRAWRQSSAPFQFEAAALAEYFGAARSAAQEERAWWADLAPAVPASAAGPLWGGQISAYDSRLRITLRADGTRPAAATLAATVTVTGPGGAGRYDLVVQEKVSRGRLRVTQVGLTPA